MVAQLQPAFEVPPPAWLSQARRNAEDTAHRWQAERTIFAVNHHGQVLYPGFQFDPETGRPRPLWPKFWQRYPKR